MESEQDRGAPIVAAEKLAEDILGDPALVASVYELPRGEFGLVVIGNKLVGYRNWIDAALRARARARAGKRRRRKPTAEQSETAA